MLIGGVKLIYTLFAKGFDILKSIEFADQSYPSSLVVPQRPSLFQGRKEGESSKFQQQTWVNKNRPHTEWQSTLLHSKAKIFTSTL